MLPWSAPAALASVALVLVLDTAEDGLRAWWRPGDLVVARAGDGPRSAVRPLAGAVPLDAGVDLATWTPIGERCAPAPAAHLDTEAGALDARAAGPWAEPAVELRLDGRLVARAPLGHPGDVCEVVLADVDALPGPELLVAWRMEPLRGLTVFRVPESLR